MSAQSSHLEHRPPQQSGPVPRATFLSEVHAHKKTKQRARDAELLAERRDGIISLFMQNLPSKAREKISGADYSGLQTMTDVQFGSFLAHLDAALVA